MIATATKDPQRCCICLNEIEIDPLTGIEDSHNAHPVGTGRACGSCNWHHVVPARLHFFHTKERSE